VARHLDPHQLNTACTRPFHPSAGNYEPCGQCGQDTYTCGCGARVNGDGSPHTHYEEGEERPHGVTTHTTPQPGGVKVNNPLILTPQARAFADACYENPLSELHAALRGPVDHTDCRTWKISPAEWRAAIETAIREREPGRGA
jgi:hypothetical protein